MRALHEKNFQSLGTIREGRTIKCPLQSSKIVERENRRFFDGSQTPSVVFAYTLYSFLIITIDKIVLIFGIFFVVLCSLEFLQHKALNLGNPIL